MNQTIKLLTGVLILQIALAVLLDFSKGSDLNVFKSDQPLLPLKSEEVNSLKITSAEHSVSLKRTGALWTVTELNFEASSRKVTELLKDLTAIKQSWPVAQSKAAWKQLKVAGDQFDKKIEFYKDDTQLAELFLGSAPTFKKVHARVEGQNPVYSIDYVASDLSTKPSDWLNKEFLYLEQNDIEAVTLPKVQLQKEGDKYTLAGIAADEELKESELKSLLSQVSHIRFNDLLGKELPKTEKPLDQKFAIEVKLKGKDQPVKFTFTGIYQDASYIVQSSQSDLYFTVNKGIGEKLNNLANTQLVQKKAAAEAEKTPENATK